MAAAQSRHHHGLGYDGTARPPAPAPAPAAAGGGGGTDIAAAAAAAAAIAARISAQLAGGGAASVASTPSVPPAAAAVAPSMYHTTVAPPTSSATPASNDDLAHLPPVERARAIAARLTAAMGGSIMPPTVAGVKRSFGEISGGPGGVDGNEAKRRRKLVVPLGSSDPSQWVGMLVGHGGSTHRALEAETGARLQLRGRGAPKAVGEPPAPEDSEDLHIIITADSDDQVRVNLIVMIVRAAMQYHALPARPASPPSRSWHEPRRCCSRCSPTQPRHLHGCDRLRLRLPVA